MSGLRRGGIDLPADISLTVRDAVNARMVFAKVQALAPQRQIATCWARPSPGVELSGQAITSGPFEAIFASLNPAAERLSVYSSDGHGR